MKEKLSEVASKIVTSRVNRLLDRGRYGRWGGERRGGGKAHLDEILSIVRGPAGSVKETAYALWILRELKARLRIESRVERFDTFLESGQNFITRHLHFEKDGTAHLGDEVWDTSLAILSLDDGQILKKLVAWVEKSQNSKGAFDGEIWETCFAVMALRSVSCSNENMSNAISWLKALVWGKGGDQSFREVVSPTYTALILNVIYSDVDKNIEPLEIEEILKYFANVDPFKEFRWADEEWANFIVVGFLSGILGRLNEVELGGQHAKKIIEGICESFKKICDDDGFRLEDAAFSLFAAIQWLEDAQLTRALNRVGPVKMVNRKFMAWENGELIIRLTPLVQACLAALVAALIYLDDLWSAIKNVLDIFSS